MFEIFIKFIQNIQKQNEERDLLDKSQIGFRAFQSRALQHEAFGRRQLKFQKQHV
jgi:hypothetical protein